MRNDLFWHKLTVPVTRPFLPYCNCKTASFDFLLIKVTQQMKVFNYSNNSNWKRSSPCKQFLCKIFFTHYYYCTCLTFLLQHCSNWEFSPNMVNTWLKFLHFHISFCFCLWDMMSMLLSNTMYCHMVCEKDCILKLILYFIA